MTEKKRWSGKKRDQDRGEKQSQREKLASVAGKPVAFRFGSRNKLAKERKVKQRRKETKQGFTKRRIGKGVHATCKGENGSGYEGAPVKPLETKTIGSGKEKGKKEDG